LNSNKLPVSSTLTQTYLAKHCRDGDPAEKLKRKIKTIADIAGDNYDHFTDNVATKAEPKQPEDDASQTADDRDNATAAAVLATTPTAAAAAANSRVTSPQAIYAKLWYG